MMLSMGCLFVGVTAYLNENLRGQLEIIKEEGDYKEHLLMNLSSVQEKNVYIYSLLLNC